MRLIKRWYHDLFVVPNRLAEARRMLVALMPQLLTLRGDLNKIAVAIGDPKQHPTEKLDLIVDFFNLTSPWHDRGLEEIIGVLAEARRTESPTIHDVVTHVMYESVTRLQQLFVGAGRHEFGYNRTVKGEVVTADSVMLGDRCGLLTKSVSYWKTTRDDKVEVTRSNAGDPMYPCDVIWWQARTFMSGYVKAMGEAILALEPWAEEKAAA